MAWRLCIDGNHFQDSIASSGEVLAAIQVCVTQNNCVNAIFCSPFGRSSNAVYGICPDSGHQSTLDCVSLVIHRRERSTLMKVFLELGYHSDYSSSNTQLSHCIAS